MAYLAGSIFFWVFPTCYLILIVGLLAKAHWARKVGIAMLLLGFASKLWFLFSDTFSWNTLIHAGAIGFIAHGLWRNPEKGIIDDFNDLDEPQKGSDLTNDDQPIISLVHLRSQVRYLEAPVLARALSDAWGLNITFGDAADEETCDGFVTGDDAIFVAVVKQPVPAVFIVHNREGSYLYDSEEFASTVPNLRFAEVIASHDSWLAIDLIQAGNSEMEEKAAYRMIGKAISSLADEHVMAILCPQYHYFNLWSGDLEQILCSDSPLDALREEIKAPVYGVPDGDAIHNAIQEARRRWPEFVACFHSRKPDDDRFLVKSPFTGDNGQVEHMWLQVFGLEPEYIHGHLLNEPFHTKKLKQGSQVEVPVSTLSDWVCADADDKPLGNFTHLAVQKAAQREASS